MLDLTAAIFLLRLFSTRLARCFEAYLLEPSKLFRSGLKEALFGYCLIECVSTAAGLPLPLLESRKFDYELFAPNVLR